MKYFSYLFFRGLIIVFRWIPFKGIYLLSNLLSVLFNKIIGYRKPVMIDNLRRSFPDKNEKEIHDLVRAAYKNLSDITLESIKGSSLSKKSIMKRYRFINPEILDQCFQESQSAILAAGHFNNWEWAALSPPYYFKHHIVALYKKLSNPYLNQYIKKSRSHTGETLYELKETVVAFESHAKSNPPSMFLMAADQSPSNVKQAHWIDFLNQKTACLHGIEKYARLYELPVIYCAPQRIRRGYYELNVEWLTRPPYDNLPDGEITKCFMLRLESDIIKNPESWLWSHKRWKHKMLDVKT